MINYCYTVNQPHNGKERGNHRNAGDNSSHTYPVREKGRKEVKARMQSLWWQQKWSAK